MNFMNMNISVNNMNMLTNNMNMPINNINMKINNGFDALSNIFNTSTTGFKTTLSIKKIKSIEDMLKEYVNKNNLPEDSIGIKVKFVIMELNSNTNQNQK